MRQCVPILLSLPSLGWFATFVSRHCAHRKQYIQRVKNNDSRELFAPGTITPPADAPVIVADGLRTPENVGALIRLAANVGCRLVCLVGAGEMKESKIRKTACMAWDYVELARVADAGGLSAVVPAGYEYVAVETTPDARNIYASDMPRRVALVVGSEVHGVSDGVLALCPRRVFIPMTGPDTSMNVSQAAAVALFEWVRRFASA